MAAGDTLAVFSPLMVEPPSSAYAFLGKLGDQWTLRYEATANTTSKFRGIMPSYYDGGGVTAYIWYATSSTSGDIDWDVAFELCSGLDLTTDGFAAVNSVDDNVASSTLQVTSVAFTDGADMDSVVAGSPYRISLTRDAVSDAHTSYGYIWGVELRETS